MPGRKRKASVGAVESPATRRRSSGRVTKAAPKYEESDVEEAASDEEFKEDAYESDAKDHVYESEAADEADEVEESESGDAYGSDEEVLKKKGWKKTKGPGGRVTMVIEIPREKSPGDTPYEDERIHPNTMEFLRDLKKNNKREWLKFHDAPYRQAEKDFKTFVEKLSEKVCEVDPTIPDLPMKDIIYRIYRDMRFTKDPSPYKPYFSVTWSRTGRKGPYAHYYLHLQPDNKSFFGGGYYSSDGETLACLREDIDQQPHQLKSVLMAENIRKNFFSGIKNDENAIVKAFCKMSSSDALKTKPKGYDADHQDIELLKLKNYLLRKNISDAEIESEGILDIVANVVEAIEPFITYLNHTVMPDI